VNLLTGFQIGRVLQRILLACMLIGANAYACVPGTEAEALSHTAQLLDVAPVPMQSDGSNENLAKSVSQQIHGMADSEEHPSTSIGHHNCKCCHTCYCVSCTGCIGGCAAVLAISLTDDICHLVIQSKITYFREFYISPELLLSDPPPKYL
jgi:hypothetical protein